MAASPPLLSLQNIRLTFGGTPLLEGVDLSVGSGERLCLVGRNGSGKSTLLKIAAGLVESDGGERVVQSGTTIRYLPQEPDLSGFETTEAYVAAGLTQGDDHYRALYLLNALGLTGQEHPSHLSGGEGRRAAIARALAPEPDVLLLDEPTNHLDLPAIEWLESELRGMRSAFVLISHDRRFLEQLSNATVWIDRGQSRRLDQGFGAFEAWRDTTLEQEEIERHKLDRKIERELDWVRYGVTARRKRNMGRLRALQDLKTERTEQRKVAGSVKMTVTSGETSGKLVIEAKNIAKSYDERSIVRDLSLRVQRGDRLGLVGPNGAGKTTLINMLTGLSKPDSGTVKLGANLQVVKLDQRRDELDPNWTLTEALTGGRGDTIEVGGQPKHVMSYMKDFLFTPEQARSPVSVLSGGERGRLMLARALAMPSNFLVLDEPTNDLDLETLDLLQEMISDYDGTVLLVSHDRDFLDRTVTSVLASEGNGNWLEYAGGYTDMLRQRKGRPATAEAGSKSTPKKQQSAAARDGQDASRQGKRRMSFNEKHELEKLPGQIAATEAEIAKLQAQLADGNLFARDPQSFNKSATALEAAQMKLAQMEDRWLTLEALKEELQG
ncbi:ATP-binding cassette, subfamily F, uup [Faunimonas pinastri]|uniref:ATP-binding protein Uup n=1 Tax=Faunimonas pinastri TaxID=1855383 RepID=A0A1H9LVB0_9HYPH|nr:ATP-binding cassette domain-containing protein [Faunimonas pinastri]SER15376.1 ATP-binding cassette, subfamily F, uup [Faunimonas pinastri]